MSLDNREMYGKNIKVALSKPRTTAAAGNRRGFPISTSSSHSEKLIESRKDPPSTKLLATSYDSTYNNLYYLIYLVHQRLDLYQELYLSIKQLLVLLVLLVHKKSCYWRRKKAMKTSESFFTNKSK